MGGTNLVCREHGEIVGGCKCVGARSVYVPCPRLKEHAHLPKRTVTQRIVDKIARKGVK